MPLFNTTVEGVTTTGFFGYIGTLLEALLGWIPTVFEAMIGSPIVLTFVILAVLGAVIAFARKVLM